MLTNEEKLLAFPELDFFTSPEVREFAEKCLFELPGYFFYVPASSTGKYHPSYALGEGGLVRHVRAAMNIYHELVCSDYPRWMERDTTYGILDTDFDDAVYLALLMHDGFKSGSGDPSDPIPKEEHTVFEHPLIGADFLFKRASSSSLPPEAMYIAQEAVSAIRSHMGKWTTSKYSTYMLPSPGSGDAVAKLVHLCDYLASRKQLEFNFHPELRVDIPTEGAPDAAN